MVFLQADKLFTWKTLWGVGPVCNFALQWCVPALSQLGGKMCWVLLILKLTTTQKSKISSAIFSKGPSWNKTPAKTNWTCGTHLLPTVNPKPFPSIQKQQHPWTHHPWYHPCHVLWTGSPAVFLFCKPASLEGNGLWALPSCSPEIFTLITCDYRTTRCLLCNTYTKETKLLQISIPIQKQHPNHADTAMLPDSGKKLGHPWICHCYHTGIPNCSVHAGNNHIFRPRHPKPSWALQINSPQCHHFCTLDSQAQCLLI